MEYQALVYKKSKNSNKLFLIFSGKFKSSKEAALNEINIEINDSHKVFIYGVDKK